MWQAYKHYYEKLFKIDNFTVGDNTQVKKESRGGASHYGGVHCYNNVSTVKK